MGVATDGIICYGARVEDVPWGDAGIDLYMEDWWAKVNGFEPTLKMYDDSGNYLPEVRVMDSTERARLLDEHYAKPKAAVMANHPIPFAAVNCCSSDFPEYIICVPSTIIRCKRGFPESFSPRFLHCPISEEDKLRDALKTYFNYEAGLSWYLASYWG